MHREEEYNKNTWETKNKKAYYKENLTKKFSKGCMSGGKLYTHVHTQTHTHNLMK